MSWLKNAYLHAAKPKESIIGILRRNLAGQRRGRSRHKVHASDITKEDFCPRKWALLDLQGIKQVPEYIPTALATTFSLGNATARLLIEEWAGDAVVGNWECIRCSEVRTMCSHPAGNCKDGKRHIWRYNEFYVEAEEYGVSGSIDAIFSLGTPFLRVAELKIMAPADFDNLLAPLPEHRVRTSLYLRLIADSNSVWKNRFNLHAATVLYVSRGYGKKNIAWDEIIPFKEFEVQYDAEAVDAVLAKAKDLKRFRGEGIMPAGICATATDKIAQKCSECSKCFSGDYPANSKQTVDFVCQQVTY